MRDREVRKCLGEKMEGRKHLDGDAGLGSGIVGEAIGAGPDLADGVDTSGRRDTLDLGAVDTALTAAATAHLQ